MSGIKYYQLTKGEELPDEFCAVRDIDGEPSEYTFYVPEAENVKLREERDHWHVEQIHAYGNWEDAYRRAVELDAENAKLRELAVFQSVIFKHMSTCPTTDCQVCPVNDECAESVHLEGLLGIDDKETSWLVQWRSEDAADVRAENDKLRELVKLMHMTIKDLQEAFDASVVVGGVELSAEYFEAEYMRELGVEVE